MLAVGPSLPAVPVWRRFLTVTFRILVSRSPLTRTSFLQMLVGGGGVDAVLVGSAKKLQKFHKFINDDLCTVGPLPISNKLLPLPAPIGRAAEKSI